MKRKFWWIVYRIIFGIVQLSVVIYVLAAIRDDNTRLIIAVLGLVYIAIAGGILYLTSNVLAADIGNDTRFHELMSLADPNRQPPDRQAELTIIQTNWITQVFYVLITLICLLTVFGSLH